MTTSSTQRRKRRRIAFANQGGSAGKTTSIVSIGVVLADMGFRVRITDLDGQANATHVFGMDDFTLTTSDVLMRKATFRDAELQTKVDNLTLVPATQQMDTTALELSKVFGGEQRLRQQLADADEVDYDLFDCAGAMNVVTASALVAADKVITVTLPGMKEMGGIPVLEETIEGLREAYKPGLQLDAVIPCAVPHATGGRGYSEAMALLRVEYADVVTPAVRRSPRVVDAFARRITLPRFAPADRVVQDYKDVVDYLFKRDVL